MISKLPPEIEFRFVDVIIRPSMWQMFSDEKRFGSHWNVIWSRNGRKLPSRNTLATSFDVTQTLTVDDLCEYMIFELSLILVRWAPVNETFIIPCSVRCHKLPAKSCSFSGMRNPCVLLCNVRQRAMKIKFDISLW